MASIQIGRDNARKSVRPCVYSMITGGTLITRQSLLGWFGVMIMLCGWL